MAEAPTREAPVDALEEAGDDGREAIGQGVHDEGGDAKDEEEFVRELHGGSFSQNIGTHACIVTKSNCTLSMHECIELSRARLQVTEARPGGGDGRAMAQPVEPGEEARDERADVLRKGIQDHRSQAQHQEEDVGELHDDPYLGPQHRIVIKSSRIHGMQ